MRRSDIIIYTPRARTSEFPTAIARGGTEFRSQVFLGASVHGYIFIAYNIQQVNNIHCCKLAITQKFDEVTNCLYPNG